MTLAHINNQITYILSFYPLFQLGNKKKSTEKNHFCSVLHLATTLVFIQLDIWVTAPELHYKHWNRRTAHVLPPTGSSAALEDGVGVLRRIHVPRFTGTWVPGYLVQPTKFGVIP